MLGANGVVVGEGAAVFHEGILGGFLDVKILLDLAALALQAAEGEVEAGAGAIAVAEVAADPRVHAGVLDRLLDIGKATLVERAQVVPRGGGLADIGHDAAVHHVVSQVREIKFDLGKRAARLRAEADAAVFFVDRRDPVFDAVKRLRCSLVLHHHQAALVEVDLLDVADVPLERFGDLVLDPGLGVLECERQCGFLRVIQAGDGGHAVAPVTFVDGVEAALEIREQPAVPVLLFRLVMYLHDDFGDHAEDAFAANAQVLDVDAVAALGHGAGDDRAAGRDHAQADHHVLDLAVNVALHPGRAGGHPAAECAVQK